jgi:hypothetical protein
MQKPLRRLAKPIGKKIPLMDNPLAVNVALATEGLTYYILLLTY